MHLLERFLLVVVVERRLRGYEDKPDDDDDDLLVPTSFVVVLCWSNPMRFIHAKCRSEVAASQPQNTPTL